MTTDEANSDHVPAEPKNTSGDEMSYTSLECNSYGNRERTLDMLPPDVLRLILVRIPAEEHDVLRATCKSIRCVLDSVEFRVERAISGFAEASASLYTRTELHAANTAQEHLDPKQLNTAHLNAYYGRFFERLKNGVVLMRAKIWVDGKRGGSADIKIVPRSHHEEDFYKICDSDSNELQRIGYQFCDSKGRPRIEVNGYAAKAGSFCYITKFEMNPEYRLETYIGSDALRSLLLSSELRKLWSITVYIADAEPHLSEEDQRWKTTLRKRSLGGIAIDRRVADNWESRMKFHLKYDMVQFLRAGFRQCTEYGCDSSILFAMPLFLKGEIMTHDEALAVPDVDKVNDLVHSPTGINRELLDLVMEARDKNGSKESRQTYAERVGELIAEGASVNRSHALHYSARCLDEEMIDILLEATKSPSEAINCAIGEDDSTPFMLAAAQVNNPEARYRVCKHLLDLGADTSISDSGGMVALDYFHLSNSQGKGDSEISEINSVVEQLLLR